MRKESSKSSILIVLAGFAIIVCGVFFGFKFWLGLQLEPVNPSSTETLTFEIESGSGTGAIASVLEDKGIIKSATAFKIKSKADGNDGKYKAAVYTFSPSMSVEEVMNILIEGKSETVKITIQEGLDIKRVVEKLSADGLIDPAKFMEEIEFGVFDYDFVAQLPAVPNRLEGYLYPETYFIGLGATEHSIIDTLLRQFDKIYTDEIKAKADSMGMTMHEVVTMASILEREAVVGEEMPTIASVFYNRMEIGMPLQTDATIQYALGEQKKRLSYDDLKIDSPYNTYTNKGLPPGPIASPSKAAIEAAVNPAETDYIYFVAKGDGSHAFSVDYDQFLKDKEAYINKVFGG